jgi:hypothetical protein
VAWGMIAATQIAMAMERIDPASARRIADAVRSLGPLPAVTTRSQRVIDLLRSDKKTRQGVVHFVLPREIGRVEIVNDVPASVVRAAVDELRRASRRPWLVRAAEPGRKEAGPSFPQIRERIRRIEAKAAAKLRPR